MCRVLCVVCCVCCVVCWFSLCVAFGVVVLCCVAVFGGLFSVVCGLMGVVCC